MNFIQSFEFIESNDLPREFHRDKIQINLDNYQNIVFSFGTYENGSYEQTVFPFLSTNQSMDHSIIFSIDPEYNNNKNKNFIINNTEFQYLGTTNGIQVYSAPKNNIFLYMITEKIPTSYPQFKGESYETFSYTQECSMKNPFWTDFTNLFELCIQHNKKIFINSWVFTNSRYFKEVDGIYRCYSKDIGHYFEYFPELGFILREIYEKKKWDDIYITGFFKVNNIYKRMVKKITDTDIL